jgi:protocatechuate 3,4-dioxygenase beta subunit
MNVRRLTPVFVVVLAALAACENGPATPEAAPTPAGCAAPVAGTATVEVIPGPTNGVPAASTPGAPLVIEAAVLDAACQPAAGANVRIWHTDATGLYGPETDRCCYYAGTVATDDAGRFRMRTIRPAQYPVPDAPPAHIHLEISHRGEPLETEIIFRDEPPPSMAPPTGQVLPIVLRPDGAGWRGEALFVLHRR